MLHITDGESVAGTLRESGVPGTVSVYGDMMFEGPAPAGLDPKAWIDVRAQFMVDADYAGLDEARQYLESCQETLTAFTQHDEVVIWLDHRLSNQLILIRVLDWFSRQNLGGVKLSLICVDRYPGMQGFLGLGALYANQLASLADTRLPVGEDQLRTAQAAWNAFTSPDPTNIERFLATDTSPLPFIAAALRRHLEQFPSAENGLSRTEQQTLSILRDHGTMAWARLFVAAQQREEAVFMGDGEFCRLLEELSRAPHALVQISDSAEEGLGDVAITETGRNVMEGTADHIDLNGIDRWLGGVHLKGRKAAWRWDRSSQRLVSNR
jgi:hypothetical protein